MQGTAADATAAQQTPEEPLLTASAVAVAATTRAAIAAVIANAVVVDGKSGGGCIGIASHANVGADMERAAGQHAEVPKSLAAREAPSQFEPAPSTRLAALTPASSDPTSAPDPAPPVPALMPAATPQGSVRHEGCRVQTVYGDEGTVRFYGTTHFKEGVWVGVDLDRAKGKNDGSVQGMRYFECKPKHGLFTRAENLIILKNCHLPRTSPPLPPTVPVEDPQPLNVRKSNCAPQKMYAIGDASEAVPTIRPPSIAGPSLAPTPASIAGVPVAHDFVRTFGALRRVESTMYEGEEMPVGWEHAWLDATADGHAQNGGGSIGGGASGDGQLPVCVFMSSMTGDRKIFKDSRWVLDFLRNKRVPFEVVDLAAKPDARQRMSQLSGDENSPLPQVQFDQKSIGIDRLRDLEDHAELDPQLRVAVRRYAESRKLCTRL